MQWDEVVNVLVQKGLTSDKENLVKELTAFCPSAGMFLEQFTRVNQDMICRECGMEGWTETVLDALGSVVR